MSSEEDSSFSSSGSSTLSIDSDLSSIPADNFDDEHSEEESVASMSNSNHSLQQPEHYINDTSASSASYGNLDGSDRSDMSIEHSESIISSATEEYNMTQSEFGADALEITDTLIDEGEGAEMRNISPSASLIPSHQRQANYAVNDGIIEIPETQVDEPCSRNATGTLPQPLETRNANNSVDIDDDDVILIPQHIEVIDLCTQVNPARHFQVPLAQDEIIEIQDSPMPVISSPRPRRMPIAESVRSRLRHHSHTSPYNAPLSNANTRRNLDISFESHNDSQTESIRINCPICLESVIKREPVSTNCGHIFCKSCLVTSIQTSVRKCPMCKKSFVGKKPYHSVFL